MKLVFFGDSLVWGGYGGDFVAEVAKLCPQHEIINAGQGGNTILNLLGRLENAQQQPGLAGLTRDDRRRLAPRMIRLAVAARGVAFLVEELWQVYHRR